MKKIFYLTIISILFFTVTSVYAANNKVYTIEEVSFNNSTAYDKTLKTPINGVITEYSDSGSLMSETSYKDGKKDGAANGYFDSGSLMIERSFKDGKLVGVVRLYYESGGLKREQPFKDGKINGVVKEYSESGSLVKETSYKDGQAVPSRSTNGR